MDTAWADELCARKLRRDGSLPLDAIIKLDILNEAKDDVLVSTVKRLFAEKPQVLADYKKGRKQALNSLIGPIMKELGGKADVNKVRKILEEQAESTLQLPIPEVQ